MTDQDPTQGYEPPTGLPEVAPAPPAVPPEATAAPAPPAPPADTTMPAFAPPAPPSAPGYAAPMPPAPAGFAAPEAATDGPVATSPVEPAPSGSRPGRSMFKWIIAAVVVLLVAGSAAGATLLLTSKSGNPAVLAWAPADSIMYAEARLDLPGNQSAELAKVMKAFPGFEDQAAFPVKLSEMLDRLVGEASNGKMSWKADIEPWFGGQVAFGVATFPTAEDPASARMVMLVNVKDQAAATAWTAKLVGESGATTTSETYNGTTISVVGSAEPGMDLAGLKAGYAVVGPVLVVGDLDSIKKVIDTKGTSGLPSNEQFKAANASSTGDRLGFVYLDYRNLFGQLMTMMPAESTAQLPASLLDKLPAWAVETFRAQDSAFVVDVRSPHSDLSGTASESKIPGLLPASTMVLLDGKDLGASLKQMKELYGDIDAYKDAVKQIDDALGILGGFDAATSWMGESAIAISRSGDTVTGGILVVPTDKAAAERLFNQLKGFVQLGGAQAGLTVSVEDYKGTPITVIDLSGLAGLAGSMAPGVDIPTDLKISYAVTADVVVLGYGTEFVKAVLDAPTGDSLAENARFKEALGRVGATNTGIVWVDVAAIRDLAEGLLPADAKATYEKDVKPYLDAFDYFISSTVPGTPYDSGSFVLHVTGS